MHRANLRGALSVAALGAGCLLSAPARADDDRAVAQALVDQLSRNAATATVTAEPLDRAKRALERGSRLRILNDEGRARAAEGAAREWAETARDLARAAEAEGRAADLRRKALDEQAQLERTRALVDEGIARVGRLRAELEGAERAAKDDAGSDRHAVEVHEGDAPPAKKAPKKSPAKPVPSAPGAPAAAGTKAGAGTVGKP